MSGELSNEDPLGPPVDLNAAEESQIAFGSPALDLPSDGLKHASADASLPSYVTDHMPLAAGEQTLPPLPSLDGDPARPQPGLSSPSSPIDSASVQNSQSSSLFNAVAHVAFQHGNFDGGGSAAVAAAQQPVEQTATLSGEGRLAQEDAVQSTQAIASSHQELAQMLGTVGPPSPTNQYESILQQQAAVSKEQQDARQGHAGPTEAQERNDVVPQQQDPLTSSQEHQPSGAKPVAEREIDTVLGEGVVETPASLHPGGEVDPSGSDIEPSSQCSEVVLLSSETILQNLNQNLTANVASQSAESLSAQNVDQRPPIVPEREAQLPEQVAESNVQNDAGSTPDVPIKQEIVDDARPFSADLLGSLSETKITLPVAEEVKVKEEVPSSSPTWSNPAPKRKVLADGEEGQREPRKWRNRRSPHSGENSKSGHKGSLNLRRLSDAEFQALPAGSRLFLGNLSTHSTSKQELFDIFAPHGEILQISIKNSFGFIQYNNAESVLRAIEKENGRVLHGCKLGLEVSHGKPWQHMSHGEDGTKSSHGARHDKSWHPRSGGSRDDWYQPERAFSPTNRGHPGPSYPERRYDEHERRPGEFRYERRESYEARGGYEYPDQRDFRPPEYREQHEFRPPRHERGGYRRGSYREEHREDRFAHRGKPYRIPPRPEYHERRPPNREFPLFRTPSHDPHEDEFPLPRRQGNEVPECQIIVLEEVERHFIWQVENAFRDAAISVHVLHLSRKKLHIQAVIRQMIVEGVHAVIFMERHHELSGRVNMQIFDQSVRPRDGNVKFDEYENIKIEEAVGLLMRARAMHRPMDYRPPPEHMILPPPPPPQVLGPPPPPPPVPVAHQPAPAPAPTPAPAPASAPAPISVAPNLLNNVNFAHLASLLGTLQQQQQQQQHQHQHQQPPQQPPQQQHPPPPPATHAQGLALPIMTPAVQAPQPPSLLHQAPQHAPQQQPNIDVQQLLRQLAPQNAALTSQPQYVQMPPPIQPNLAPPAPFGAPMIAQQSAVMAPNPIQSNGLAQHQVPNISQFGQPAINPATNVADLVAQFKQFGNQR